MANIHASTSDRLSINSIPMIQVHPSNGKSIKVFNNISLDKKTKISMQLATLIQLTSAVLCIININSYRILEIL